MLIGKLRDLQFKPILTENLSFKYFTLFTLKLTDGSIVFNSLRLMLNLREKNKY